MYLKLPYHLPISPELSVFLWLCIFQKSETPYQKTYALSPGPEYSRIS